MVRPATAQELNRQLSQLEHDTTNQFVVAIFPEMQTHASVADYTLRIAKQWGVGQNGRDNGVVLFIFAKSHELRIQVGSGLEAALPNSLCQQIITEQIVPHFRQGDYDGGSTAAVKAIIASIRSYGQQTSK
jgi:uncharacterized protein